MCEELIMSEFIRTRETLSTEINEPYGYGDKKNETGEKKMILGKAAQ
tara:strand:+ start:1874 stop:2014 length:141 start_codon:yes stop_codon:yes gene_type:complete